jgi:hypothetical protein
MARPFRIERREMRRGIAAPPLASGSPVFFHFLAPLFQADFRSGMSHEFLGGLCYTTGYARAVKLSEMQKIAS